MPLTLEELKTAIDEKNVLPVPPLDCSFLMEELLELMLSIILDYKKSTLKKLLKKEKEVILCYLKNSDEKCMTIAYLQSALTTAQSEVLAYDSTLINIVSFVYNNMMRVLLSVQVRLKCCEYPCVKKVKKEKKEEKKHKKEENHKCTACGNH